MGGGEGCPRWRVEGKEGEVSERERGRWGERARVGEEVSEEK